MAVTQGEINKNIAFFIKQQFPGIYREDGAELVQLVEDYYRFAETQTNQHNYISRRIYEIRDVDTTLADFILFFQKKFLQDLPLKEDVIKFIVKNILDLYRRKGTAAGIELFFAIFYEEFDLDITYPAKFMLKASNSEWRQGVYLQLFPNTGAFFSQSGKEFSYLDLISRNITGSASGAKAAVSKVNFIILNGIETPIIYLDALKGNFQRYDDLIVNINGEVVSFGRVNGSLSGIIIDEEYPGTTGNKIGDIYNVISQYGGGGRAIVTELSNKVTGEIDYNIDSGGFGYTIENTRLLVSNQTLILPNANTDYIIYETLVDTANNQGIIIGQNESTIGVRMNSGQEFDLSRPISTLDRSSNFVLPVGGISPKNESSPGALFPDTGVNTDVKVSLLTNTFTAEVITDPIQPHLATVLNIADYEVNAPFSGTASPVNLSTPLDEAFDIQPLTIGTIADFANINPGTDYVNDVFARAEDEVFKRFERKNQILRFAEPGTAGNFTKGEIVADANTGIQGAVVDTDTEFGFITVTPYSYYGFEGIEEVERLNGDVFPVIGFEFDYNSRSYGDNAVIDADTEFAVGKIKEVAIDNSGFGYIDGFTAQLVDPDDGEIQAQGTLQCLKQGVTSGFWANYSGHINGYIESANGVLDYYTSGQRIQDSDYYQEYSYQIKSKLGKETYEKLLKENMHLAGTKMFGDFIYKAKVDDTTKARFVRLFNDDGRGSPLDIANIEFLDAAVTNYYADSTFVTADHVKGGGYSGPVTLDVSTIDISDSSGNYPSTTTITVTN